VHPGVSAASPWLLGYRADPRARVRLLCFPYAGGGATLFARWHDALPVEIDVCAVQLPGRQTRVGDPPIGRLDALVDAVDDGLSHLSDLPWALFGHSFGSLVAYELVRRRQEAGDPACCLFVAGCSAPHLPPKFPLLHLLDDQRLLRELGRLESPDLAWLDHPELLELALPAMRADLTACETYRAQPSARLTCPITAFAAVDDPRVPISDVDAWREQTEGQFVLHEVAGGHFFLEDRRDELLLAIERGLKPWTT